MKNRWKKLIVLLLAACMLLAPTAGLAAELIKLPTIQAIDYAFIEEAEQHIFKRMNELRQNPTSFGVYNHPAVPALEYKAFARDTARYKTLYMAAYNDFSHEYTKGPYAGGEMALFSYTAWGENIAAFTPVKSSAEACGEQLFQQWLESPGHLANMMYSRFTFVGIGVVYAPNASFKIYGTQQFGADTNPQLLATLPSPLTSGGKTASLPWKGGGTTTQTNSWVKDSKGWYYRYANGGYAKGWLNLNGTWYYLDPSSGYMVTGWAKIGNTWYYLRSSGAMATGWVYIGGKWYYLRSSGAMATGWVYVGGKWYWLTSSGAMATGWVQTGGYWYWMDGSGAMFIGTRYIGDTLCHFNSSGRWMP